MTKPQTSRTSPAKPVKAGATKQPLVTAKKTAAVTKTTAAAAPKADGVSKATVKPARKAARSEPESKEKPKKAKLVRDSFTMPEAEYVVLSEVKKACLKAGIEVKKSELLRVGVMLIRQLDTSKLKEILAGLPTLKAGRPKKNK